MNYIIRVIYLTNSLVNTVLVIYLKILNAILYLLNNDCFPVPSFFYNIRLASLLIEKSFLLSYNH